MSKTDATVTNRPKDASAWKQAGIHDVTLPSGMEVSIKIPNLPEMVKNGAIPNNLLDAALGAIQKERITKELIAEQADFFHMLVETMVKEPAVTAADVPELPYEDIELLVEIGTRQRDLDALGRHISGLHRSAEWRRFRGLDFGDSALEDE
jgi:hypothetical protein